MAASSEETIIVRDRDGLRRLNADDEWTSMTPLGALSADPRSFDELASNEKAPPGETSGVAVVITDTP